MIHIHPLVEGIHEAFRSKRWILIFLSILLLLTVAYFYSTDGLIQLTSYAVQLQGHQPDYKVETLNHTANSQKQNSVNEYVHNKTESKPVVIYLRRTSSNTTRPLVSDQKVLDISVATQTPTSSIQRKLQTATNSSTVVESARGYVIAMNFWEQMTKATSNLLDLQCWAARHHNSVVEPYSVDSLLFFTFDKSRAASLMKLEDMFDMDDWRRYSKSNGLAPLVNQEEFFRAVALKGQTWNVILVQMQYYGSKSTCKFTWQEGVRMVGTLKNMKVARKVCIGAKKETYVSVFDRDVYGKLSTDNTIVVFNEWRGIGGIGTERLRVKYACTKAKQYICHKHISQHVLKDAEEYAQRYLGGFGQYIAVMARFEKSTSNLKLTNKKLLQHYLSGHIQQTLLKWKALKTNTSITATFLAFDYGKFGSGSFKKKNYFDSKTVLENFHQTLYYGNLSLHDWEMSFEQLRNTTESGYIALLQLAIATNAKCIILVGEHSNFLSFAINLYKLNHSRDGCMEFVGHPQTPKCP